MTILAIDFGTSRIKAAYWDEESGKAVVLPLGKGGRLYVPSLFHVSKDGKIRFGDEAEVMLHHDPQGIVENLKLDLDKPIKYVPNGQQVKSAELMALLFRRIIEYATRQVPAFGGSAPKTLVLTLPSRWDYSDIYMDALDTIGYTGEKVVIREPEAAGLAWVAEQSPKPEDMLVVLDFGGGTIDWACLRVDEKGQPQMIAELPPGGITAAGSHVDAGLFDEMMKHINEEQRQEVQQRRAQVLEQIRQLKESQNGTATLSGEDGLEVQLGAETFVYPKELFDQVVKCEVIDQAIEGIGGYLRRVARMAKSGSADRQLWCVMAGGTRLLSGLEERVKEQLFDIGKSSGVVVKFSEIGQADFATAKGAVRKGNPVIIDQLGTFFSATVDKYSEIILSAHITCTNTFYAHSDAVYCISYSPDGRYLVSGGADHKVKLWDVVDGAYLREYEAKVPYLFRHVAHVAFTPNGKYLAAVAAGILNVWDVMSEECLYDHEIPFSEGKWPHLVRFLSCSPDSGHLVIGDIMNQTIYTFWFSEKEFTNMFVGHEKGLGYVLLSPDGKYLAAGGNDGIVRIWDVKHGKCFRKLVRQSSGFVEYLSYSPDGKYLVSGSRFDEPVEIWDVDSGVLLRKLKLHFGGVRTGSYSPNGRYLALSFFDNIIRLFAIDSGELLRELVGHTDSVICLAYSPDGKCLASGSRDGTVRLWSLM